MTRDELLYLEALHVKGLHLSYGRGWIENEETAILGGRCGVFGLIVQGMEEHGCGNFYRRSGDGVVWIEKYAGRVLTDEKFTLTDEERKAYESALQNKGQSDGIRD